MNFHNKITSGMSGFCLGFAASHVFIYQLVIGTILSPLGVGVGGRLRSDLGAEEALALLFLSFALRVSNAKIYQWSLLVGVAAWLGMGLFA